MAAMTSNEEAQLAQTIEMFEVITQSQPLDYASLEILKEAYLKLGRQRDVVNTSKRIAQAYVMLGQLSSAILEYESILQQFPDDPDVKAALNEIESKANTLAAPGATQETELPASDIPDVAGLDHRATTAEVDDGRAAMQKVFVESRLIGPVDFNEFWRMPDLRSPPVTTTEPFIQALADRGLVPIDKSLKILSERSRLAFLPLEKYEIDPDVARLFPRETCMRWCVLPFDRMSKSIMVATANPFNKQAAWELESASRGRLLWYLSNPTDILRLIRKILR